MSEKIHENMKEAQKSCECYITLMSDFKKQLGVWEENDDSCSITYVCAKFYNENGKVETFCIP